MSLQVARVSFEQRRNKQANSLDVPSSFGVAERQSGAKLRFCFRVILAQESEDTHVVEVGDLLLPSGSARGGQDGFASRAHSMSDRVGTEGRQICRSDSLDQVLAQSGRFELLSAGE